jgi:signal transduction histidine kinase
MSPSSWFEKFILGPDAPSLSRSEYKRIMLTGYLSLLSLIVSVFYTLYDISSNILYSLPGYASLAIASIIVSFSIRNKKYSFAKILLMVNANLVVFYSALNDPPATGTCMVFIPAATGSFAMFGFQERIKPILIAFLSTGLFLLAFFGNLQIPHESASEAYITTSFIINFVISLSIVVSVLYFLGSLNQISEQGLIEKENEEKSKNDQLMKINNELDRFIYSLSHDLKSPLSSIQGLVTIGKLTSDPEEIKKCLSHIEDRVKAQEFFINEIIEIYRNNRVDLKPETIDLKKLIEDIIKETSFEPGADKIQFVSNFKEPILIESDKVRLKSILFNLVGNAIKYHDPSKTKQFIRFDVRRNPSSTEIIIEDNGRGIGDEHLPKIFDMFYRASSDSKGSGLGLYIVKEVANKLNGSITAESKLSHGSKFTLRLQ